MKISVCIPTFNQASYIGQAIESVLKQTVPVSEIIIANDCSTDKTLSVIEEFAKENSHITVINRAQNVGITKNTDDCLRQAKGDYIVRLDSDDMLEPNYVEELTRLMKQYPEAGYAHAAVQEIDQFGNRLLLRKLFRKSEYQTSDETLQAAVKGYRVAANIILFKKEALQKVNYLQSKIDFAEDYHLTASIAAAGYGNVYSNQVLANYRVWTDTGKARKKRKLAEIQGLRAVFEDVLQPAFYKKGWNDSALLKSKESFASNQADCLGWNIYNDEEKKQLEQELLQLSSTRKARFYIQFYKRGWGKILQPFSIAKKRLRLLIKQLLTKAKPA